MEQVSHSSITEKINDIPKYPIFNKISNYKCIFRKTCPLNKSKSTSNIIKTSRQKPEIQKLHKQKENIKDLLELIRKNAINNYTKDLQNKSIDNLKSDFINQINNHKKHTDHILIENEKKVTEYILKYEKLVEENSKLKSKIESLNNIINQLNKDLENSEKVINELKNNIKQYEKYKFLLSKFEANFPGKEPIEIIKEIIEIREGSTLLLQDKNDLILKIQRLKQDINIKKNNNLTYTQELQSKISFLEKRNEDNINKYNTTLSDLNEQLNNIKTLKKSNKFLKNILYSIYNKLFESFRLNKDIKINNKYLNITKEDFDPILFNDEEVGRYIMIMISSSEPSMCGKLLRETVAYSNMILREYLQNKNKNNNLRYDPIKTFKELKNMIEEKEKIITTLNEIINSYKNKLNNKDSENKKLENSIKKLEIEKTQQLNKFYSTYNNKDFKKIDKNFYIRLKNNKNKKNKTTKFIEKKSDCFDNKKANSFVVKEPDSSIDWKLNTHSLNHTKKYSTNYSSTNHIDKALNLQKRKRILSADIKKINCNNSNNISTSREENSLTKMYMNRLYQSLYSMKKKKITKLKKDKNIKNQTNKSVVNDINKFNYLINHTNRLLFYRINLGKTKKKKNSLTFSEIPERYKKFKDDNDIEAPSSNQIEKNIYGKINGLINDLTVKQDKK